MSADQGTSGSLRAGSIGLVGVVFFVVATVAPMSGSVGALPLAFGLGAGAGTAGAFVIVAIVLILFAVGYMAMSHHMATAGGFYVYIGEGLGLRAARAAGYLALLAYNAFQVAIWGTFGYFFNSMTNEAFGWNVPWLVPVLIGIAIVGILGYFEINISAKILGVAVVLEILVILVLNVAIFAQGGAHGLTLEPFSPHALLRDDPAVGLMFCFLLFIGFEATAIYGEEARDPYRTIPRAAIIAVLLIAIFYIFTSWAVAVGWGVDAVRQQALTDPGNFVFSLGHTYVGGFEVTLMKILFLTSTFATNQGFHNAIARYQFSLAREGWAPSVLGRTHPRYDSPYIGSYVQTAVAAVTVLCFWLAGADPYTEMFTWLIALGALGLIVLMATVSVSAIVFFRRYRVDGRVWVTVIAPALAAIGLALETVLLLRNWNLQTGATGGPVSYLPVLLVIPVAIGLLWPVGGRPPSWLVRDGQGAVTERGGRVATAAQGGSDA